MTEMSRRGFLKGLLTVAAVSVVPVPLLDLTPRIVGDGIHDDTLGLQAALDGKPFACEGQLVTGGEQITITGGSYRITSPLYVRRSYTHIVGASFDGSALTGDEAVLNIGGAVTHSCIGECRFVSGGKRIA